MKGSTGIAGLVVTALVAALVSFAVAALLGPAPLPPPAPAGSASGSADLEREVASLRAGLEELRASRGRPLRGPRSGPGAGGGDAGVPLASGDAAVDGAGGSGGEENALPATREDLVALIDDRISETGAGAAWKPPPPKPRVTVEEAGAEIGLTAFEIDAVRRAYETAETEMITCVMGTADLDTIKEEVRAAKEDPDRKAALVQKAVGNVIRNLGKVMTIEDRRDRDLKRVISEDQMTKLKGYNLKPTLADAELENILKDAFGNR